MADSESKSGRRAVVKHIDREAVEANHLSEAFDRLRDVLEGVAESATVWHVGLSKTGQVGSDEAKPVRELRDEIAEHVPSSRKAVQQKDRWRVLGAGLPIENADAVNIHLSVSDRAHGKSFRSCDRTLQTTKLY